MNLVLNEAALGNLRRMRRVFQNIANAKCLTRKNLQSLQNFADRLERRSQGLSVIHPINRVHGDARLLLQLVSGDPSSVQNRFELPDDHTHSVRAYHKSKYSTQFAYLEYLDYNQTTEYKKGGL